MVFGLAGYASWVLLINLFAWSAKSILPQEHLFCRYELVDEQILPAESSSIAFAQLDTWYCACVISGLVGYASWAFPICATGDIHSSVNALILLIRIGG